MNFDDLRKLATLPTATLSLCVAGELSEQLASLQQRLADTPVPTNLGDGTRATLKEQIGEVRAQMREASVDFHLRALPARAWTKLWGRYPTRSEGEDGEAFADRMFAFHAEIVAASAVDPAMSVEQVGELVDVLHGSAWIRLANACISLNAGEVDIPNSEAASDLIPSSDQT